VARSETKTTVAGKSTRRKPKLGQNFLTDHSAARRIVDALGDISNRTVIEIGPGRGMLTDLLVKRARKVIGIELDHILAAQMRMRYATLSNVEVLESDFVTVEWQSMVGRRPGPLHDLRPTQPETVDIVGNLPYYVTSDIVLRILREHESIGQSVIMVQREVADRITAEPGSRDYGLLSATTRLFARAEKLFTLPPSSFDPPPQVHSSVVRLTMAPRANELNVDPDQFEEFLKLAFEQKRKTLVNNLKQRYGDKAVASALKLTGIRPDARAEALSLDQMAAIFRTLNGVLADSMKA
jgi:16S rRNA (adenine1518-N6/adenine1519-N6)-dimethyltransferase